MKIFSLIFFSSFSKYQTRRRVRPNHLCTSYTIAKMRNRELRLCKNPNFPHHCTTEGSFGFLQKYIGSCGLVRTPIVHIFYYLGLVFHFQKDCRNFWWLIKGKVMDPTPSTCCNFNHIPIFFIARQPCTQTHSRVLRHIKLTFITI